MRRVLGVCGRSDGLGGVEQRATSGEERVAGWDCKFSRALSARARSEAEMVTPTTHGGMPP
jgi:hypothetical protein